MKSAARLLPAMFALLAAFPLAGQRPGVVRGTVADSATGEPVVRGWVTLGEHRWARGLPDGGFVVDSVVPGRHRLRVTCTTSVPFRGRLLHEQEVVVGGADPVVLAIRADARGCDQRPIVAAEGEYRGFYEGGFEHSRFVPCPNTAGRLVPPLAEIGRRSIWVWAEFGPGAVARPWPPGARHRGFDRWYVEWRGTIRGPDQYGHLSSAEYEAQIDSVLVARRPGRGDCSGRPARP